MPPAWMGIARQMPPSMRGRIVQGADNAPREPQPVPPAVATAAARGQHSVHVPPPKRPAAQALAALRPAAKSPSAHGGARRDDSCQRVADPVHHTPLSERRLLMAHIEMEEQTLRKARGKLEEERSLSQELARQEAFLSEEAATFESNDADARMQKALDHMKESELILHQKRTEWHQQGFELRLQHHKVMSLKSKCLRLGEETEAEKCREKEVKLELQPMIRSCVREIQSQQDELLEYQAGFNAAKSRVHLICEECECQRRRISRGHAEIEELEAKARQKSIEPDSEQRKELASRLNSPVYQTTEDHEELESLHHQLEDKECELHELNLQYRRITEAAERAVRFAPPRAACRALKLQEALEAQNTFRIIHAELADVEAAANYKTMHPEMQEERELYSEDSSWHVTCNLNHMAGST